MLVSAVTIAFLLATLLMMQNRGLNFIAVLARSNMRKKLYR
jgi:hypothetical protein